MERQHNFESERYRPSAGDPPDGNRLDEIRQEARGMLRTSDHYFDLIDNLHAQQYLEQNMQTGGE